MGIVVINFSYSQKQLNLDVDNDLYFDRDFYYSSGIFLSLTSTKVKEEFFHIDNFKLGQLSINSFLTFVALLTSKTSMDSALM